jgi:hypothetical protein
MFRSLNLRSAQPGGVRRAAAFARCCTHPLTWTIADFPEWLRPSCGQTVLIHCVMEQ